jgi:hypothetical protein
MNTNRHESAGIESVLPFSDVASIRVHSCSFVSIRGSFVSIRGSFPEGFLRNEAKRIQFELGEKFRITIPANT